MPQLARDIIALSKPRIILLLVITCLGAMFVATRGNMYLISFPLAFWTCLGLALSAAGANMVNMWYDRDIDAVMSRTQRRPLPQGRLHPLFVLGLGGVLGVSAFMLLWCTVNLLTALMAASGYLFYVFIYTMFLKRRTVQNIVIGGAAGAFPPLVGWAAVQNSLDPTAWFMFAVIFFWTPPHFWALALYKCKDYTKAGVPMLPVVKGDEVTKRQMMFYLLILVSLTLSAVLFEPTFGMIYFLSAFVLGGIWIFKTFRLMRADDIAFAPDVFKFSLYYLAFLFLAMVVDTFIVL
ncbi:MAG: protoheme IX farnesyltransferase [Magnetococcales bacterium]|jgi:protoheme IX farnesyltransferase|nr:protoheme IX farnesyltransferase [Magnetococcales bacterium]|tara:strand:+ start:145753 stop:146631 length:879 start_codon:yes stop_codon:yes gene_type:complete